MKLHVHQKKSRKNITPVWIWEVLATDTKLNALEKHFKAWSTILLSYWTTMSVFSHHAHNRDLDSFFYQTGQCNLQLNKVSVFYWVRLSSKNSLYTRFVTYVQKRLSMGVSVNSVVFLLMLLQKHVLIFEISSQVRPEFDISQIYYYIFYLLISSMWLYLCVTLT